MDAYFNLCVFYILIVYHIIERKKKLKYHFDDELGVSICITIFFFTVETKKKVNINYF